MAEKYEETRAKLRRDIVASLKEASLNYKEGIQILTLAFVDIVAATGKLNGENPKEFVLNLLHQTEQGVSKALR